MTGSTGRDHLAEFCAGLRSLQERSGISPARLAERLSYSRSQIYAVLHGKVRRIPDWDRLVLPLVRECSGGDPSTISEWRRRHEVVTAVLDAVGRRAEVASPSLPSGRALTPVPAQLPHDVPVLAGRDASLEALDAWFSARHSGGPSVVVLHGPGGVGKTTLATRWATIRAAQFPEGQLFLDLRGFSGGDPLPAAEAAADLLRDLGVRPEEIPPTLDGRSRALRTRLAAARMVLVLDNAVSEEQVRPLLPGSPSVATVVTSRNPLGGFVALGTATVLPVEPLSTFHAVELLRRLLGAAEVDKEFRSVVDVADRCNGLPLALRLAAYRASVSELSLQEVAAGLAAAGGAGLLAAGPDARADAMGVIAWSYVHLDPPAAEAFRRTALLPGPVVDRWVMAAMLDAAPDVAAGHLSSLVAAGLADPVGEYGAKLHDLARAYAGRLQAEDPVEAVTTARGRLVAHYRAVVQTCMRLRWPRGESRWPRDVVPPSPLPPLDDMESAMAWLDSERGNVVRAARAAFEHGRPGYAHEMLRLLARDLDLAGLHEEAAEAAALSVDAAEAAGDEFAVADSRVNQAGAAWVLGRPDEADAFYADAARRFAALGEALEAAKAHGNRAGVLTRRGRLRDAQAAYEDALLALAGTAQTSDVVRTVAAVRDNLGLVLRERGRWGRALELHQVALAAELRHGTPPDVARAQINVAAVVWRLGSPADALVLLDEALPVLQRFGDQIWVAAGQTERAVCRALTGDVTGAGRDASTATRFFRRSQDPNGCGAALIASARVRILCGDLPGAVLLLGEAIDAMSAGGDAGGQSEAEALVGDCHLVAGRAEDAESAYLRAVRLAEPAGTDRHLLDALRGLASCRRAQGDEAGAAEMSSRADQLETELNENV